MNNIYFIAMIYEGIIIIITGILVAIVLAKYIKNRNTLILLLFLIVLNYLIAIMFSWLSKVHILYSNFDYILDDNPAPDPLTPLSWIILRISGFRISFLFISIATIISYFFKIKIFEKGFKKSHRNAILIYGIFTIFYSLVIYQQAQISLDNLAYLFVFILMGIVFISFMRSAIRSFRNSSIVNFKKAFACLAIMSLSFVLVLFNFLINSLFIFMGSFGFTLFYYLGWIFVIIGEVGAYFGLLHLTKEKNLKQIIKSIENQ